MAAGEVTCWSQRPVLAGRQREGRLRRAVVPAALSQALHAQKLSWGQILRLTQQPEPRLHLLSPTYPRARRRGSQPPADVPCHLQRGPPGPGRG